jgi:hypothetical protein
MIPAMGGLAESQLSRFNHDLIQHGTHGQLILCLPPGIEFDEDFGKLYSALPE